jgi:hypothetical protein
MDRSPRRSACRSGSGDAVLVLNDYFVFGRVDASLAGTTDTSYFID